MLDLTFACGGYDRVQPLRDGSVSVEGVALNMLRLEPEECFWRMMQGAEFDVAEMSLSSYCIAKAKGDERFVGIPAFLSRSFRHSSIYLSPSTDITDAKQLAGRRIGVPEYQMTASVWTRGMLANDCGVDLSDVTWVTGGLEQPGRVERQKLELPDSIRVESVGARQTLAAALEEGEIDALMAPRVPRVFRRAGSGIRRLFPDYAIREKDYFARTGLFPIMHMVVVRKDVLQDHPWVAASLYKALREAKEVATAGLSDLPALRYTMPFLLAALEEQEAVFGPDPWPYGMEANRTALETFISYLHEQGLVSAALAPESLFAPSTLREFRI
ncbi:ABC transporter substrate-binding protein [Mycolicibacterium litorale]|uniref:ABC transporter substrate-binding protein n=1 Tax=Mycolicibacterium litorale TaxID=758802 RepID=UPI003CF46B06